MKEIGKALILPAVAAAIPGGLYLWQMLHVWPPGKEGWMEEGMIMTVFHLILLGVLLPVIVWSVARAWRTVGIAGRLTLIAASLALLAATVILPEVALKRIERTRPNQPPETAR